MEYISAAAVIIAGMFMFRWWVNRQDRLKREEEAKTAINRLHDALKKYKPREQSAYRDPLSALFDPWNNMDEASEDAESSPGFDRAEEAQETAHRRKYELELEVRRESLERRVKALPNSVSTEVVTDLNDRLGRAKELTIEAHLNCNLSCLSFTMAYFESDYDKLADDFANVVKKLEEADALIVQISNDVDRLEAEHAVTSEDHPVHVPIHTVPTTPTPDPTATEPTMTPAAATGTREWHPTL